MSQSVTKGVSDTVVVLAAGALFGMAALLLRGHLGLDPSSVHTGPATGQAALLRFALAWWAWWIIAMLAFFVGRESAALTRLVVANWWLFRDLRLLFSIVVVLALVAVGRLLPARPDFGGTTDAMMSLGIVALATVLAVLGARSAPVGRPAGAPAARTWAWRSRAFGAVGSPPPALHDGSVNAGLPSLGMDHRRSTARASPMSRRRPLTALATGIAVAGVSALSSASVVLNQNSPQAVRERVEPKRAATVSIRRSMDVRPPRASETVGESRDTSVPLPPSPIQQPAAVAGAFAMVTPDERELTFAKGYARRRAALEAAGMMPTKPPIKVVPETKRGRAAAPRADGRNRPDHIRSYDFQRSFGGG